VACAPGGQGSGEALLRRLGRAQEAAAAYERAAALTDNAAERRFLTSRRAALPT